jgi:hypothetical protein
MTDDIDAKAHATAHGLIQGYIGPDHKVLDMKAFYSALVQALKGGCADAPKASEKYDVSGHLQEIGLICAHWAYLEYVLGVTVWWLEGEAEQPISTKKDCAPLAGRAAELAAEKLSAAERDLMERIKADVIRLTPERNLAVHGRGEVLPDETVRVTVTRGPYANAPQQMSPEQLGGLNRELADVNDALNDFLVKHGVMTIA